jgi:hypothetical protein
VSPHVKTRWAQFSIVEAILRALELLYRDAAPDWFVLLSGADYPTMRSDKVLIDLTSNEMDVLLDFQEVLKFPSDSSYSAPDNQNPGLQHFGTPENSRLAWRRYVASSVWFPILRSGPRLGRYTVYFPFEAWRSPFGPDFKCFYGSTWLTGNRKVAEILLKPTDKHMHLRRYLRWRVMGDECYFQTVLGNAPHLKIDRVTRRFCVWDGGYHPNVLGLDDLPAIVSSKAHFARKFSPDSPVLDEIDRMLS